MERCNYGVHKGFSGKVILPMGMKTADKQEVLITKKIKSSTSLPSFGSFRDRCSRVSTSNCTRIWSDAGRLKRRSVRRRVERHDVDSYADQTALSFEPQDNISPWERRSMSSAPRDAFRRWILEEEERFEVNADSSGTPLRFAVFTSVPFVLEFIACWVTQRSMISSMPMTALTILLCAAPVIHLYLLLPLLDLYLGAPAENTIDSSSKQSFKTQKQRSSVWYRVILWAVAPAISIAFCYTLVLSSVILNPAILLLSFSLGALGGIVISASHELLHSSYGADRFLASFLLSSVCYVHWATSHMTHHRLVGTTADPATARKGESFYKFFPRCVFGNMKDAVLDRKERLIPKLLCWILGPLSWAATSYLIGGYNGLCVWIIYVAVAVTQLELVNYIEHYGLERDADSGSKVDHSHSWNANYCITNYTIFNLQRHSDHHCRKASYEQLYSSTQAKQLPGPYPAMMILALFPHFWSKFMDPRLTAT